MDFQLPPLGGVDRVAPPTRTPQTGATRGPQAPSSTPAVTVDTIPASPPPEVLEQMQHASQVFDQLLSQQRQLHFEPNKGGRIVIQVQDLQGNVIRSIPPSHALDIAAGRPLA